MKHIETFIINKKEYTFGASDLLPVHYKLKTGRSIEKDLNEMASFNVCYMGGGSLIPVEVLDRFEILAHLMARIADKNTPSDRMAWLDGLDSLALYDTIPALLKVWRTYNVKRNGLECNQMTFKCVDVDSSFNDFEELVTKAEEASQIIQERYLDCELSRFSVSRDYGSKKLKKKILNLVILWNTRKKGEAAYDDLSIFSAEIARMLGDRFSDMRYFNISWKIKTREKAEARFTYMKNKQGIMKITKANHSPLL